MSHDHSTATAGEERRPLNAYRLGPTLGVGLFGQSSRAHDAHGNPCAVKVLHAPPLLPERARQRCLAAAQALIGVGHSNLVPVQEVVAGPEPLVVTALLDGSLAALFPTWDSAPVPPLRDMVRLFRGAAEGLAAAHAAGLVHGNLKPSNLLCRDLTEESKVGATTTVCLSDFGEVPLPAGRSADTLDADTLAYALSPEHCYGQPAGPQSDLYGIGTLLYRSVFRAPPFAPASLADAVYRHVYEQPRPPIDDRPLGPIGPDLTAVILRCLSKSALDRYATAQDLADALGVLERSLDPPALKLPLLVAIDQAGRKVAAQALSGRGLTIGRQASDIVLDAPTLPAYQLQVDWDGRQVIVTSQEPAAAGAIDGVALARGEARVWPWQSLLRLGPYWLQLVAPEGLATTAAAPPAPPPLVPARTAALENGDGGDEFGLACPVPSDPLELIPGRSRTLKLTLTNNGNRPVQLTLDLVGGDGREIATEWLEDPLPLLYLNPGQRSQVDLRLLVPASSRYRAGDYEVQLRARYDPGQGRAPFEFVSEVMTWRVRLFLLSELTVRPKRRSARLSAGYVVRLRNVGNTRALYRLSAIDEGQHVELDLDTLTLEAQPGKTVTAALKARPYRIRWLGAAQTHNLTVAGGTTDEAFPIADGAQPSQELATVTFEQLPIIPGWVPRLLPLLLVLALLGAYLGRYVPEPIQGKLMSSFLFGVLRPTVTLTPTITAIPVPSPRPTAMPTAWVPGAAQQVPFAPITGVPIALPEATPTATAVPSTPESTATATPSPTPLALLICPVRGTSFMISVHGATPGRPVSLYFDDRKVGGDETRVREDGTFSIPLEIGNEQAGLHRITVRQDDRVLVDFTCLLPPLPGGPTPQVAGSATPLYAT